MSAGTVSNPVNAPMELLQRSNLLGLMQEFNSLVPSSLVYVEQTELHQTVGHQVVVEPDLLFTEHIQKER